MSTYSFTMILLFTLFSIMIYDLQNLIFNHFGFSEKSITSMEVRMSTLPKAKLKIPDSKYEDDPLPAFWAFIALTMSAFATLFKVKSSRGISNYPEDVFVRKHGRLLNGKEEKQEHEENNNFVGLVNEKLNFKESPPSENCRNDFFEERLEALDEKLKSTEEITQKWSERIRQTEKELAYLREQIIGVKNVGFFEAENKENERENLFRKIVDEVIRESRNELKEEAMYEKLFNEKFTYVPLDNSPIKEGRIKINVDVNRIRENQGNSAYRDSNERIQGNLLSEKNETFKNYCDLFSDFNYYKKENMLKGLEDLI